MSLISQLFVQLPYPTQSFANQVIIVTGANTGLGLEASRHFVRLGAAKVILGCRSVDKGREAVTSIESTTKRNGVCEIWPVDLGDFASVKSFTDRAAKLERLDVVCENAGVASFQQKMEGWEGNIAINVLATFLMALNLLPTLRKSGKKFDTIPRLVVVSSDAHAHTEFKERHEPSIFEKLNTLDPTMTMHYPTSKLLQIFIVRALVEAMASGPHASEKVIVNLPNPGFCVTMLSRQATGLIKLRFTIMKATIGRSAEVGSRNTVNAAAKDMTTHGKYLSDCKVAETSLSHLVTGEGGSETQEKVFKEVMEILEDIQPGIGKNI